jgi:hypothetical protein
MSSTLRNENARLKKLVADLRDDSQIQERLRKLAREHPRFGYRRLHSYLHREMAVNNEKCSVCIANWADREAYAAQASAAHCSRGLR